MPKRPRDVVLDTNVVSELARGPEARARFYERVEVERLRVVVPELVCREFLTRSRVETSRQAIREMASIFHEHPGLVGASVAEILLHEEKETLEGTPTVPIDGDLIELIRQATNSDDAHAALLEAWEKSLSKDAALKHDRKARDVFFARMGKQAIHDLDELMDPQRVIKSHFFEVVTRHSEDLRRRVLATPARYPATVMLASLQYLIAMGASFANIGYGRFQGALCAPRKGDWVDARIAASAAYARWLVTDDKNMIARVRHVSRAFDLGPEVITLSRFLDPDDGPPRRR